MVYILKLTAVGQEDYYRVFGTFDELTRFMLIVREFFWKPILVGVQEELY